MVNEDFDFIICDMVMPKLPGHLFYLAVKRMKPHLCSRFIFITGYAHNPAINDFVKRVKPIVLFKPFQMENLLEAVTAVQVMSKNRSSSSKSLFGVF